MKKLGKSYSFRGKEEVFEEACYRAAGRVESYTYRRKYDPPSSVLSVEALSNMHKKLNKFDDSSTKIWEDRGSRIAIPYGSELFLNNERGIDSVLLGSTRNYFDDLSNPEHEPDARPKFPYDQDAHNGANKIKKLFLKNLKKRNRAARIVQRNTKKYIMKKTLNAEVRRTNDLIAAVQRKFRYTKKRLRDTRIAREEAAAERAEALKVEQHALLMKQLAEAKDQKFSKGMLHLTRAARAFIHFRRRERGRGRRFNIAATRIQTWFRFCRFRRRLKKICDARVYIIYRWRKYYRRKYKKPAGVLQRLYRRKQVKLRIHFLQRIVKGALGRRKYLRKRLEVLAVERARNSRECVSVTRKLKQMSESLAWTEDDQQVPPIAIADHMLRLDRYCMGVLEANALQYDPDFHCLHPAEYECENEELKGTLRIGTSPDDSLSRRIVIAILNIFVNRPGECLDSTSFNVCHIYLKPTPNGKLSMEAWKNLLKYPMMNVEGLSKVVEPTSATLKKVKVSGRGHYLPVEILAKAVLVYRWTMHYEWATKQAVIGFRVYFKPRRVCPKCQYPMTFDGEVLDHRVCFNNGSYMAWMSKDLDSCRNALYEYCCNPKTFKIPYMKRDVSGDKVKLSNADLAATKMKYENFRTAHNDHDNDDIADEIAQDKKKKEEAAKNRKDPTNGKKAKDKKKKKK